VILDLQASKWRIGTVKPARLEAGAPVELVLATAEGEELDSPRSEPPILPIPHPDFFAAARIAGGGEIALNDAKVMLQIEGLGDRRITARVIRGGEISAGKGITLVGSDYRKEQLNQKDRRVVELARSYPFVRFALSYVKDALEMSNYRRLFSDRGGDADYLIAKVERTSALEDAEGIARNADELWICRGDLGAEMGAAAMAEQLFRFFPRIREIAKPVYLAGQVLEHLTVHPAPTRSEISYLYEALQRGFAGFVLSDETAIGPHPLEACRAAALFRSR
jgi:pyruvate kinase